MVCGATCKSCARLDSTTIPPTRVRSKSKKSEIPCIFLMDSRSRISSRKTRSKRSLRKRRLSRLSALINGSGKPPIVIRRLKISCLSNSGGASSSVNG
ncbi:hypothetical protein THIOM_000593 [Candidatus Thiomargarita nelsonii]|uniref:Uncharacterized protein n=1 Tax=Candidatus Thiomargarita nelsonii TaxID=1003181 RepID=A0A176S608_9GAMM|nr:hypothetical protein THIOM_000593 [Candidatus Thiomargarita nelsonii]